MALTATMTTTSAPACMVCGTALPCGPRYRGRRFCGHSCRAAHAEAVADQRVPPEVVWARARAIRDSWSPAERLARSYCVPLEIMIRTFRQAVLRDGYLL